jgi:hypothetical protein
MYGVNPLLRDTESCLAAAGVGTGLPFLSGQEVTHCGDQGIVVTSPDSDIALRV